MPAAVTDISAALLDYFHHRLKLEELSYADPPTPCPDGWEAQIYRFQLAASDGLPPAFRGPLCVRAYCSARALHRLHHEMEVQRHLADEGYPAPRPLFLEEDGDIFGGPFLVMNWIGGHTLLDVLLHHVTSILWAPARMAAAHARLHQLPAYGVGAPRTPFLERSLATLDEAVSQHALDGLARGLGWLDTHRPPACAPSIIHLDFHPINLIFHDGDCRAVLDWGDADVGDRHADVATTLMLMELAPIDSPSLWDRFAATVGKRLLQHRYYEAYCKLCPLDEDSLRYYMAWASLRRLATWGTWLHVGPAAVGAKPTCLQHVPQPRIDRVCRLFEKYSGVAVDLRAAEHVALAGCVSG